MTTDKEPRFCVDCKWSRQAQKADNYDKAYPEGRAIQKYARCVRTEPWGPDLVDGKSGVRELLEWAYCHEQRYPDPGNQRQLELCCGREGRFFEARDLGVRT